MSHNLVGQTLGPYRLHAALGAGAMSEVYLGRDERLQKEVAVKVILEKIAQRADLVERFEREARATARLEHPNVAKVHYFATHDGKPYFAMELVRGWSLEELCEARARFTLDQVLAMFAQCAEGLQAALDAGIVHRDIKPANLMVTREGRVKIVDFGLARLSDEKSMTRSGTVMGTPFYIAPEIVAARPSDHRADLYSLGVSLYHMLAGAPPFDAETPYGVMMQHIQGPIPDLSRVVPGMPRELADLIAEMMAKDPADRPADPRAFHVRLRDVAAKIGRPALSQPWQYCSAERVLTHPEGGTRCGSCHRVYGVGERPERYHVDVEGWRENDGKERVSGWMARATGRSVPEVQELLATLPYRLSNRTPRDRARRMQRQLHDLGADVRLVPVPPTESTLESAPVAELPFRAHWPSPPSAGASVLPSKPTTKARLVAVRVGATRRVEPAWFVALAFAVLAIALALRPPPASTDAQTPVARNSPAPNSPTASNDVLERAPIGGDEDITPLPPEAGGASVVHNTPVQAEGSADGGTESATTPGALRAGTSDSAPAATPTLESRWFQTNARPDLDVATQERALAALDAAAADFDGRTSLMGGSRLALRFTTDSLGGASRRWMRSPTNPTLEFPVGDWDDSSAEGAARHLVARAAMRRLAGPTLPQWLSAGLAGVFERGAPSDADVAEATGGREMLPSKVAMSSGAPSGSQDVLVRGFAGFLIDAHGWGGVRQFLEHLGKGRTTDDAAIRSFGTTLAEIEAEWSAAASAGD